MNLCGDGMFDSRGYSAYYCRYAIMDAETKLIVSYAVARKDRGGKNTHTYTDVKKSRKQSNSWENKPRRCFWPSSAIPWRTSCQLYQRSAQFHRYDNGQEIPHSCASLWQLALYPEYNTRFVKGNYITEKTFKIVVEKTCMFPKHTALAQRHCQSHLVERIRIRRRWGIGAGTNLRLPSSYLWNSWQIWRK